MADTLGAPVEGFQEMMSQRREGSGQNPQMKFGRPHLFKHVAFRAGLSGGR